MYTFNANVIIYYLNNDPDAVSLVRGIFETGAPIYVSAITEVELFSFSHLDQADILQIETLLNTVSVMAVDSRIARLAGFLRQQYRLNIADSIIAATALFTGTTLATRNVRDFKRIKELSLLEI